MNIYKKIITESMKVLIFASILSSFGGLSIKLVEEKLIMFVPLFIILPALNNMIGDFGIIIVSKFTTHLYEQKIKRSSWRFHFVKHLFKDIFLAAIIATSYMVLMSIVLSKFRGFTADSDFVIKLFLTSLIVVIILVLIIFFISIGFGFYVYKKNEDPDDLVIPITTSIADLGSMAALSILVYLFF